jgi:peptidoglycan/xylan/chitin deacetylase (PgdA/CDA1 family)
MGSQRGKRDFAAALLHSAGVTSLLSRRSRGRLVVLNYHRIRPDGARRSRFDEGVYGPTESQFASQVAWLKRHFRILSESDLIDHVAGARKIASPAVMVTFDDGYRDSYTLARPILVRHGVPALFFVSSQLVDERRLGPWDRIAHVVKRARCSSVTLGGRSFSLADREAAVKELILWMQEGPESETRDLAERLAIACEVPPATPAEQAEEIMTWDQIRECADQGIAIGSHGHSHRTLARLGVDEQRDELVRSRDTIASRIGREVRSLAYPLGGRTHFTPATMALAAECGYALGFSFRGENCFNDWGAIARFDVMRTAAPASLPLLAATASLPGLFA